MQTLAAKALLRGELAPNNEDEMRVAYQYLIDNDEIWSMSDHITARARWGITVGILLPFPRDCAPPTFGDF